MGHKLFEVLASGRRLRSIRTKTSRHKTSFFTAAVGLINKAQDSHLTWTLIPPHTPSLCYINTHYIAHCTLLIHIALLFCILHSTFHFRQFIYLYRIYCVFWFLCVV